MARGSGGTPWVAVLLGGLIGAVVATAVVATIGGQPVALRAAAAAQPGGPSANATASRAHSVTFIGDSWTEGFGATALNGYAYVTAEQLGWDYRVMGVGGSGYSLPGRGATFDDRVDRAMQTHPDVIVFQGSLNERASTPEALSAAAEQTFAHVRRVGPHTRVLVVGSTYDPGTPNATIDWINDAVGAAAERYGYRFVNPATENWLDKDDPSLWHDIDHPGDAGCQVMADRLEPLLLSLVGS